MAMIEYRGYLAKIDIDEDARLFHGDVINLRDVITFEADCMDDLLQAFHDSVDDYLEFCEERGEDPEKPFSGKFLLRLDKELHRKIHLRAQIEEKSLNSWVSDALSSVITEETEHTIP